MEKPKKRFQMPHAYVIIFIMTILTAILANIVPAGTFDRVEDASGNSLVVAGSFHFVDKIGCSIFDMFKSIQLGFVDSAQIIFFIIFAYAFVYVLLKNGTFDALVGGILRKVGDRIELIIPVCMILFGLLGSTMGLFEETYGLIPVFISIAVVLGYDAVVGSSVIYLGVAIGFAAATINPFTIGVAQEVSGVALFSGLAYRIVCFAVFMGISIWYVWRYAHKIKANPAASVLYGETVETLEVASKEELAKKKMEPIHKISCLLFVLTIVLLLVGTIRWGWYIDEIATLFIIMTIVSGFLSRYNASQIAEIFIDASKEMMYGALLVGVSRSIAIIMENAMIIDTIVNWLAGILQNFQGMASAFGMLIVQNIINFFIPSGAGQALVTMPILAPVGELVGVSRQVSVLAYQFGDGFSNIFWPTSVFMMCGIMRVPINKWYKFVTPLFCLLFAASVLLLCIAVVIGY